MTGGHPCLVHHHETELRSGAVSFLSDGLRRGERVAYCGWGPGDHLRVRLSGLKDLDDLVGAGVVTVTSLDEQYSRRQPPEPAARVRFWSDATNRALSAGFSGLRVVIDTTPWLQLPEPDRRLLLRSEQALDRFALDQPFVLLCVCDATVLGRDPLADIVSIHSSTAGFPSPFCMYPTDDADFALVGEVDAFTAAEFDRVLAAIGRRPGQGPVVLDAHDLRFVDHTSLLTLERNAERLGVTEVTLLGAPPIVGQVAEILGLQRVRVVA